MNIRETLANAINRPLSHTVKALLGGQVPHTPSARSPKWRAVRDAWIKDHGECIVCGGREKLQVHHIRPYHLNPDDELNPDNFATLCEANQGFNCHLTFGHLRNYKGWNPDVLADSAAWKQKLAENKVRVDEQKASAR